MIRQKEAFVLYRYRYARYALLIRTFFVFFWKGRLGHDRSRPCGDEGANMLRLLAAPREVADKRGQVVGGRGAKATDDYTQCISAVFSRITFSQMAHHVSVSVSRIM